MLLAGCLTLALLLHAVPALAQRAPSDEISERALATSNASMRVAPDIDAASGILVTDDGRVLWSRHPNAQRAMASTTKMMTALVALQVGHLDEMVTVSKAATKIQDGAGLAAGERLSERQLLTLMLVHSANDAAYALGEHVGGTIPAFSKMMNDEAVKLGLRHTHYVNPHGLDQSGQYSSAADLAKLAHVLMSYPVVRGIVVMRSARIPGRAGHRTPRVYGTTDELLGRYHGLLGVKTGYTDKAGYCFVGCARRGGVTLMAVVMGTQNNAARFTQASRLLDWGFRHVGIRTVASVAQTIAPVPVSGGERGSVAGVAGAAASAPVFDLGGPVKRAIVLGPRVVAPVFAGEPLGTAVCSQGAKVLARVPLLAEEAVKSTRTIGSVPVSDYLDRTVEARVGDVDLTPSFEASIAVRTRLVLRTKVAAPVSPGERLGAIEYTQDGRLVVSVPVVAAAAVPAPGVLERADIWVLRTWRGVFGGPKMAVRRISGS